MFMTSDQSITSRSRPASAIVPVRLEYGTRIVEWTEHFQLAFSASREYARQYVHLSIDYTFEPFYACIGPSSEPVNLSAGHAEQGSRGSRNG